MLFLGDHHKNWERDYCSLKYTTLQLFLVISTLTPKPKLSTSLEGENTNYYLASYTHQKIQTVMINTPISVPKLQYVDVTNTPKK